jgi:hypothetical protein
MGNKLRAFRMNAKDYKRFDNLTFEDFRRLASDSALSAHEKVGFPNSYREGREAAIFGDVCRKLPNLQGSFKTVLEIGPGCSQLPAMLAMLCENNRNRLLFVDSAEMLALLPDGDHIAKYPGPFPAAMESDFASYVGKVDAIIAYSVIQYVFQEGNLWDFMDRCLQLLSPSGEILFGDVPNATMRKRFMASEEGLQFHRAFAGDSSVPEVTFGSLEPGMMDDSVVLALVSRARAQGFHAWILPQHESLPMANRREDIVIKRP